VKAKGVPMKSHDSETTGVDLYHGARPFFWTSCNEAGDISFWEWRVDPLTRKPIIPKGDMVDIEDLTNSDDGVLHNTKFDATAWGSIRPNFKWPWHRTHDTLISSHLLASNQPHDLTSQGIVYLRKNIQPFEDKLEKLVQEARRYCRSKLPNWRIAKKGLEDMPSAKAETWKLDMWLLRAVAEELAYPEDHPYWTAAKEYANEDSPTTLALHYAHKAMEYLPRAA